MNALVIGGAASGKSAYAERLALCGPAPRVYLATMDPTDSHALARIERHRGLRAGKGFLTCECARDIASCALAGVALSEPSTFIPAQPNGTVLVECIGTLVANEMYGCGTNMASDEERVVADVLAGLRHLSQLFATVIAVSNDVTSDGIVYDEGTQSYIRALSRINAEFAQSCTRVVEVVCGIPIYHKGEEREHDA